MEDFQSAPDIIDKLILQAPDYEKFLWSDIVEKFDLPHLEKAFATANEAVGMLLIDDYKYVSRVDDGTQWNYLKLTDLGREVKRAAGHYEYLKKQEEKAALDQERQKLNDEKLRYDVKNAKRIFRTYWWTFGFSISALLLALGKILYDIFK